MRNNISVHVASFIHCSRREIVQIHTFKFEHWKVASEEQVTARSSKPFSKYDDVSNRENKPFLFLGWVASLGIGPTHSSSSASPSPSLLLSAFRFSSTLSSGAAIASDEIRSELWYFRLAPEFPQFYFKDCLCRNIWENTVDTLMR